MTDIVILIKTYKKDYKAYTKLIRSISEFNIDDIPVYVAINDEDYDFFKAENQNSSLNLLKDSDIYNCPIKDAWRYQQVIKSKFYLLNVCKNYLCIDSDSEFITPFRKSDFLFDENTPYTIIHESKSFLEMINNIELDSDTVFFKSALQTTRKLIGNKHTKIWDYGPSPYLWSCLVWKDFNENFLSSKNMTFEDFMNQIDLETPPSETVIYGEYLLKTNLIPIYPIEGFFKVYHFKKQFSIERRFHNIEKLKKVYLGVIFQSNWDNKSIVIKYLKRKIRKVKLIYSKIKNLFVSDKN
ncbi:hypothetical protein NU08_3964 [Flavobacterium anhuiense]|uniref:Uncharacterized protein n=1 Tax=Flavobacterium anhuiense TaxID=459526 RepID=A0A444VUK8_9FLAO|nr:hypothetical protein [Flavobacterium anhuiense]RYJ37026.1 hypothetical protein NU08_3964 [Flavobacterium anhuiense]